MSVVIKSSADLRSSLMSLMDDVKTHKMEVVQAREIIRAAAQINQSLQNDIQAARLGLDMARLHPDKLPLAIGPVKM